MQEIEKDRKIVDMKISIHPELEDRISKFQKDCLIEEIQGLPPIKDGDININTDFIFDVGDKYEASIFIRNGLDKPVNFELVAFLIVNKNCEVMGQKTFDLREVGEVPPYSVRPWKIYFTKDELILKDNELKDLKIVFGEKVNAESTVNIEFEDFPSEIQGQFREKYEKFLKDLPILRRGQVSLSAYDVQLNENGGLSLILIIRNGSTEQVKLERLPVRIKDSRDIEIASGIFELGNEGIVINPSKAKLYSFIFPKENILEDELHLDKWTVDFQ